MTKYIKTGTTEFEQFNETEDQRFKFGIIDMANLTSVESVAYGPDRYMIPTLERNMVIHPTDWIATGVEGEHWPVKNEIFKRTYRPVWTAKSIQEELAHYGYADLSYNRRVINAIWELFSGENN